MLGMLKELLKSIFDFLTFLFSLDLQLLQVYYLKGLHTTPYCPPPHLSPHDQMKLPANNLFKCIYPMTFPNRPIKTWTREVVKTYRHSSVHPPIVRNFCKRNNPSLVVNKPTSSVLICPPPSPSFPPATRVESDL